jgi:hypothetical protein
MRLMRLCMVSAWSVAPLATFLQPSATWLDSAWRQCQAERFWTPVSKGDLFALSCYIMYYHGISYLILIHWIEPFPHLQSLNFVLVAPSSTWQAWLVSLKVRGHLRPGFARCNAKKHHTSNIQVENTIVPSRPTQTVSNHPKNKIKSSNQNPTRVKLFSPS